MADDGGVLGNLPRSRPGQRSDKRTGRTAAEAARRAERTDSEAAAPAETAARKRSAPAEAPARKRSAPASGAAKPPKRAPREAAPASESRDAQPASHAGDPVGDAIRTVTGVAATGARVAGGVAREVLRRLPRP
jgi:hypothetical protein